MAQFDNAHTVVLIKNRMKRQGIDLDRYIGRITSRWDTTPCGFGFTCKDRATYMALMQGLIDNPNFGSDSMIGGSQHKGASFREVSQPDSLHIILSSRPDPSMSKPSDPVRATCSVHLDSVSVVAGRDPKTRQVIYDPGKVLQHLATDLKHTPLIMPGGERGIVFGFRF
jgi:hypothetical protein